VCSHFAGRGFPALRRLSLHTVAPDESLCLATHVPELGAAPHPPPLPGLPVPHPPRVARVGLLVALCPALTHLSVGVGSAAALLAIAGHGSLQHVAFHGHSPAPAPAAPAGVAPHAPQHAAPVPHAHAHAAPAGAGGAAAPLAQAHPHVHALAQAQASLLDDPELAEWLPLAAAAPAAPAATLAAPAGAFAAPAGRAPLPLPPPPPPPPPRWPAAVDGHSWNLLRRAPPRLARLTLVDADALFGGAPSPALLLLPLAERGGVRELRLGRFRGATDEGLAVAAGLLVGVRVLALDGCQVRRRGGRRGWGALRLACCLHLCLCGARAGGGPGCPARADAPRPCLNPSPIPAPRARPSPTPACAPSWPRAASRSSTSRALTESPTPASPRC
jgi:hypothetical protein